VALDGQNTVGIDLYWRDEAGKDLGSVGDPQMLFSRFIASSDWPGTACLRFLDAAGDAVLNQLQIPVFIHELQSAMVNAKRPLPREHLNEVLSLANRAKGQTHTYLWFIGD
jgi:hypothetical protein